MFTKRFTATALTGAVLAGGLCLSTAQPAAAVNKEETWRYITYGTGAATAYGVLKNKDTVALIGGVGSYLSYQQWQKAKKQRREKERRARYGRSRTYARSTSRSRR